MFVMLILSAFSFAQGTKPSYCDSLKSEIKVTISGTKVSFSAASSGSIGSYEWVFGDGTSNSKDAVPTHDYGKAGTYTPCVYLIIKNPRDPNKPCTTKVCKTITVGSNNQDSCANFKPSASFTIAKDGVTAYFAADQSTNYTYSWDFGDNTTSTDRAGTHKYKPGTYKPCVTITSTKPKCKKTICFEVTIKDQDSCANFNPTATLTLGSDGSTATFEASASSSNNYTYYWNFGDGTTSTDRTGKHTFKPGTYKPCVTITSTNPRCTKTICFEITVQEKDSCRDFNPKFEYKIGENGLVYFYGSSGTNYNYHWSFGDGTSGTGVQTTHQYKPGTYKPCVTITSTNPKCEKKYCFEITIKNNEDPCKGFNPTFSYSIDGTVVKFEATYGENYTYSWSFGSLGQSTDRLVKFDFKKPGTYKVCVTITDKKTKCTKTICKEIIIKERNTQDPCKNFNPQVSFQINGAKVKFEVSGGKGSTFNWSFGDGSSSTDRKVVHEYKKSGKYTVCVTVYDAKRKCKKTICFTIEVTVPNYDPCKDFNPNFTYSTNGNKVTVEGANISGVQYTWSWGDKSKESSGRVADHTYKVAGKYVLCMTAYDPNTGCKKTICKYIYVGKSRMIEEDGNNKDANMIVYPNPADTKISVMTNSTNSAKILIKDQSGTDLLRFDVTPNDDKSVDLLVESLPKGIYFIYVEQDGETQVSRFMK